MYQIKETNITLKSKFLRSTSFHFKCPKNAPCLWFRHFSSDVRRCTYTCLKHFTWELKCTNQSCRSQRVAFSKWCCFLIRCILAMLSTLSWILYEGRKERTLQQKGPQGQNQFWCIVSKTCFDFLEEFIYNFFSFKMKSVS